MNEKNLPLLLTLAYTGYNRALPYDGGARGDFQPVFNAGGVLQKSFCNLFVQFVLSGFAINSLAGMTANEMVKFMSNPANGWISPAGHDVAQAHANTGVPVIAGATSLTGHGHVCLVLPGILGRSNSYGADVPHVVNVGRQVFFGKRVSYAFTPGERPTYYAPAGMIS